MSARLSSEEMADLCALADGSLPASRRAAVEARLAASPELRELYARQRRAVLAAQALAADDVPESLQASVATRRPALGAGRRRARRLAPRVAVAAAALAAAVVAAIVLSGGPGAPTIADAARLATLAPTEPAPPAQGTTRLAVAVEGVAFPNFEPWSGWRALGVRRSRIDGRAAITVVYGKDGRRLGYVIVAGRGLARPSDGSTTVIRGEPYQTVRVSGRLALTWRRGGHTCVLLGQATRAELLELASWPLTPRRG